VFTFLIGGVAVVLVVAGLIRFINTRLPRSEPFLDFTPLRDAREQEPAFTERLQKELAEAGSVERAYLVVSNINDKKDVLTLGLRFFADSLDENLLRRLDAVNNETSGGKRLIAMLPLGEFDERQAAKVANPIFGTPRQPAKTASA